jgi:xanthine dehydrogenase accessory factor
MKDLQNILRRTRRLKNERTPYVLATVVQVEGSAYRGPGTRMLIESLDKSTGSISGGCLEGDVRQQSIGVLADGKAQLLHYDYTGEDDFLWGTGMGCSGVMRVFLERNPAPSIAALEASALNGESALLATIFRAEDGQHASAGQYLHIDHSGMERGDISGAQLQKKIRRDLQDMAEGQGLVRRTQSVAHYYEQERVWALLEALEPPTALVLFGAGYDAEPLVQMAAELGWRVSLADHRLPYARAERFPSAERVWLAPSGQWPEGLQLVPGSAALVMSHNYLQDQAMLRTLLRQPLGYLGILGPRQRSRRIVDELARDGIVAADPQRLYAPIGLDLGAQTPEEIALAALAEIQAVLSGRGGNFLRDGTPT